MYQPPAFREDRIEVQHALIRAHPLGLLITAGPTGLLANYFPFLIATEGDKGRLRLHMARANPQWRELDAIEECLVVFQGPQDYVTPFLVCDQARDRQGSADLELRHGARLGAAARRQRRCLAAPADRRPDREPRELA